MRGLIRDYVHQRSTPFGRASRLAVPTCGSRARWFCSHVSIMPDRIITASRCCCGANGTTSAGRRTSSGSGGRPRRRRSCGAPIHRSTSGNRESPGAADRFTLRGDGPGHASLAIRVVVVRQKNKPAQAETRLNNARTSVPSWAKLARNPSVRASEHNWRSGGATSGASSQRGVHECELRARPQTPRPRRRLERSSHY